MDITTLLLILLTIAVILCVAVIVNQNSRIDSLKAGFNKLVRSFNELDEQAKLIVRTDLELNKAQEELDKRLNGLDALQKTSRLVSTTLDENEIYQRLNQPLLMELGFERILLFTAEDPAGLKVKVSLGFSDVEKRAVLGKMAGESSILGTLRRGETISSIHTDKETKDRIIQIFQLKHFILTPIMAQKNLLGIAFAGNPSEAFSLTEGDEELLSLLADQIGQAVENARLFEQVYRSSQSLEQKVMDRTRELERALDEVRFISNMKSEFISAVSHELRTPLTSIKGYASILITGKVGDIPEKVKERLEKINKHSDNLVKLINDLLDIARIESGRAELKFSPHNITNLIENVHDLLTPQLRDKNIEFQTILPPETPAVAMDSSQVERVLINLVGNAIKFTPEKGAISVKVQPEEEGITVAVSDTGIGIKEEDLKRLFHEFYRVENEINQNVKGTGLGLALAKKIVQAHGGKMWVTSRPQHGSTFSFFLPRQPQEKAGA